MTASTRRTSEGGHNEGVQREEKESGMAWWLWGQVQGTRGGVRRGAPEIGTALSDFQDSINFPHTIEPFLNRENLATARTIASCCRKLPKSLFCQGVCDGVDGKY
jgi:hypothetical protein